MGNLRLILLVLFLMQLNMLSAQHMEYEVSVGPQTTKAVIKESDIGIVSNDQPLNDRLLAGYSFNLTIRTKDARFQPGLRIKNDLTRYNIYEEVFWPADFMSEGQSRWDHIYTADRLGLGANLRWNIGSLYIQPGFSYLFSLSQKTSHEFYYAFSGETDEAPGVDYSSGAGSAGELEIGIKLGKVGQKKFGVTAGFQYLFVEQTYTDEVFLRYWVFRPMDFYLQFSYRFIRSKQNDQP